MELQETLVHRDLVAIDGNDYEVLIYSRADGRHIAKTFLGPNDVVINDGPSMQDVLLKHRSLLTLAIDSRAILCDFKKGRAVKVN